MKFSLRFLRHDVPFWAKKYVEDAKQKDWERESKVLDEFEDFFIDIPTTHNLKTGEITRGKPKGFFYQERVDGTKIHTKLGAVIMWKDDRRRYILNPYAKSMISEEFLRKMTS